MPLRATERLSPDEAGIARAAALLSAGGLVAFPTETVYGLGVDAGHASAIARLFEAKGRPSFNPLIAHVPDRAAARREGEFGPEAEALAEAFWPGPLTLVVPLASSATTADLARAGLDSIGLRVPAHPVARELLRRCGRPIAAPSANLSGRVSPTEASHVGSDLAGRIDAILDSGRTAVGIESTIVACLAGEARLLRPGGVPREEIERVLGRRVATGNDRPEGRPLAPGGLAAHYAPRARVKVAAERAQPGEAALSFGPNLPGAEQAVAHLNLSRAGDLTEAAANLFGFLRLLDASGAPAIAIAAIPERGLGCAINDRLRRASARD